jgi:heme-degrading monooxygenase HmoA
VLFEAVVGVECLRSAVRQESGRCRVIVQLVRYGSSLTYEEVMERFEGRSDRYREVPGLLQKYYVHYSETDEYGGVYIWESEAALQRWRDTNLAGTLAETYQVTNGPTSEVADVMLILHGDKNPL